MKRFSLTVFIVLMIFAVAGCGKKSGLEGKVVDGMAKPMAHVKIIAKQVQPIKGYEQFEAVTDADGTFRFKKLFPTSEYILFPWFEDWSKSPMRTLRYEANKFTARFNKEGWTTKEKMKAQSGPEGQTIILKSPLIIQPTVAVIEGKVVDGKKQPLASIKVFAMQKKPVPGYERFEAVTGADGTFRFAKLFPYSKYTLIPSGKAWTTNAKTVVTAKGEQEALTVKISVRLTKANGVVHDSVTGLMWATHDNGKSITWPAAKAYCAKYKSGGFSDWRLPTYAELKILYKAGIRYKSGDIINISACCLWATKASGSTVGVSGFNFYEDDPRWRSRTWSSGHYRALPVRSGK